MTRSKIDTVFTDDTVPELRFKQWIGCAEWPCIGRTFLKEKRNSMWKGTGTVKGPASRTGREFRIARSEVQGKESRRWKWSERQEPNSEEPRISRKATSSVLCIMKGEGQEKHQGGYWKNPGETGNGKDGIMIEDIQELFPTEFGHDWVLEER